MGLTSFPTDHDRQDASSLATRCATGTMPNAVSLSKSAADRCTLIGAG
jgi:hypothetical protein